MTAKKKPNVVDYKVIRECLELYFFFMSDVESLKADFWLSKIIYQVKGWKKWQWETDEGEIKYIVKTIIADTVKPAKLDIEVDKGWAEDVDYCIYIEFQL